jgi:magnesium-transporting ATPase (P-type)
VDHKEELLNSLYDKLENNLELIGSTGIEDKLQDEVRKLALQFILYSRDYNLYERSWH